MKEYILLDENDNVVKHICADDNFTSEKYKVVQVTDWTEYVEETEKQDDTTIETDIDTVKETEAEAEAEKTRSMLTVIDLASIRSIRAILSGTDTEEDHKTLETLENLAASFRKEHNTESTTESSTESNIENNVESSTEVNTENATESY